MAFGFENAGGALDELPGPRDLRRTLGIEKAVRRLLLGGVMPLWLGAGLADWNLHRRTRIEETAGPRESLIHHLMFAETGVPVLLGLFCDVNTGVLATSYAATGVHWATAYWDQAYHERRPRPRWLHRLLRPRARGPAQGPHPSLIHAGHGRSRSSAKPPDAAEGAGGPLCSEYRHLCIPLAREVLHVAFALCGCTVHSAGKVSRIRCPCSYSSRGD